MDTITEIKNDKSSAILTYTFATVSKKFLRLSGTTKLYVNKVVKLRIMNLTREKNTLHACIMMVFVCYICIFALRLQGLSTLSLFESAVASDAISISDEGIAIQYRNQLLYLNDLTPDNIRQVFESFVYGGIMSTLFAAAARSHGFYFHYRWLNSSYIAIVGMAVSLLLYTDAVLTWFRYGYQLVKSLYYLDFPMPQVALIFMVVTREEHHQNDPLRTYITPKLLMILPLVKLLSESLYEGRDDGRDSTKLAVKGQAGSLFTIHIESSPDNKWAAYKLEKIRAGEVSVRNDSFNTLAQTMDELDLSAVYISPLNPSAVFLTVPQETGGKVKLQFAVLLAQVSFLMKNSDTMTSGAIVKKANGLNWTSSSDLYESFPPELLSEFLHSRDRSNITNVRSMIAPDAIEEVAGFLRAYSNNDTIQMNYWGKNYHYYLYQGEDLGKVSRINHTDQLSYFTLPDSDESRETTVIWSSNDDGQEMLALDTGCNDDENCITAQYVIPAWFSKLVTLQLSYLGYVFGFDWAQKVFDAVHVGRRAVPNFETGEYQGSEDHCPVCMSPSGSSNPVELSERELEKMEKFPEIFSTVEQPVSLQTLACGHPICEDCLEQMIQGKVDNALLSAWKLRRFSVDCPTCKAKSSFSLLP